MLRETDAVATLAVKDLDKAARFYEETLGLSRADGEGDEALVAIKGKDIDLVTSEPEQVLAARTGWQLPLQALRWWVLGVPAPQASAEVQLDAVGRVLGFSQLGWQLAFDDYRDGEPALPGRIEARRDQTQATVIVESLRLGAAP